MIAGIDFSLTATGVCAITGGEAECVTVKSKVEESWWEFPERAHRIAFNISQWVDGTPDAWLIESPSFGSKGQLDRLFAGWWIVVDDLTKLWGSPPLRVAPAQLKKFATGKGNAAKDEVLLAAAHRYLDVNASNNNETDALVLAAIGAAAMGQPFSGELPKYQQDIVDDVLAGGKEKR